MNQVLVIKRSCLLIPYRNEKVERTNRVLLDRALAMLNDNKLPPEFWAEMVATASHKFNI